MTIPVARKVCVWLKDGRMSRFLVTGHKTLTQPEPGVPVFIVAFDEEGEFKQADIYFHDGYAVSIGEGATGIAFGANTQTVEIV